MIQRASVCLRTIILLSPLLASCASAQSQDLAKDYYQHGLNDKAKDILISQLHNGSTTPAAKAKALYLLGQIAFDENRVNVALGDWQALVHDYPQTAEGREISGRLKQLTEIVGQLSDKNVTSAIARSYISNGDFWTSERIFTIDSSWLPRTEMAVEWYDRVIKQFPGSDAAEFAFERKMFALIGGKKIGEDVFWGLRLNFKKYLPLALDTFSSFEAAFPNDSSLQAFRYQIAQAYWRNRDWVNTRAWLQKIIDKSGGEPSFYAETAKARLSKIEY